MPTLILYTGGARSGKSRLAQERLKRFNTVAYIATGEAKDAEMQLRIEAHKLSRPPEWLTIEAPHDLCGAIGHAEEARADAVLIDCLTLWLSNQMLRAWPAWNADAEEQVLSALRAALERLRQSTARECVMVTNEVGSGIVPEHEMGRAFRDLAGRANQITAERCDEVFLTAAGLALRFK